LIAFGSYGCDFWYRLDVIIGININCLTKSVTFSKRVDRAEEKFLAAEQVKKSLDGEACVFMMFTSLKEGVEKGVGDFPVVREFL